MLQGFGVDIDATGQLTPSARAAAADRVHLVRIEVGAEAAPAAAA